MTGDVPSINRPRQAVVIIHGIGEQRPMETLRTFVKGVMGDRAALSKPDRISTTLELRRMAVAGDAEQWQPGQHVSTDFYELYWAHLMEGTSWRHVTAWMQTLMLRWPSTVPRRLLRIWICSWLLAIAVALATLTHRAWGPGLEQWPAIGLIVAGVFALAKSTGFYFGLQYVGDAARYLSPSPPNIGVRHDIRSAAIDLLEGLHEDPLRRYHRIVVVGHSLGTVIGYDALTHLWQRRHHPATDELRTAPQPAQQALLEPAGQTDGRQLQERIWREQRAIGVAWKITDFITLGSPLAHAPFLMAHDAADFEIGKRQREFPTCPPQPEDPRDFEYGRSLLRYQLEGAAHEGMLLHHAALFGCTRWTNLHFDGDIVGGPLRDFFGGWVRDRGLTFPRVTSHTHYWTNGAALNELKRALELDEWWTPENTAAALSSDVTS